MSVTSNELRMPTPLDHLNDANTSAVSSKLDGTRHPSTSTESDAKSAQLSCKPSESLMPVFPSAMPAASLSAAIGTTALGVNTNDAYVDEFYRKISEYYRGIFSNIDIKDPNISADVLNYYQLIRQFYEQTMAINIQRNTALGLGALNTDLNKIETTSATANLAAPPLTAVSTLPSSTQTDVSTIDLTIHKPTPTEPMTFNNIQNSNSFQNNININIGSGADDDAAKDRAVHETLVKMNDARANDVAENKVTISSAGVSINVSSLNANSLKISCKTTPPKKRYSVYNHLDDESNTPAKPLQTIPTPQNLNRKFEAEAMTATKRLRANSPKADGAANKSGVTGVDELRSSAATRSDMAKSGPAPATADTPNSLTDINPITSTYLQLMRSMGFNEDDALKFDNLVSKI